MLYGRTDIWTIRNHDVGTYRIVIDRKKSRIEENRGEVILLARQKVYRRITSHGYVEIKEPDHHRARGNGFVFEHIVVLEKKLGRKIKRQDGHVHHRDGNKQNNDPSNLELMSPRVHHSHHFLNAKHNRTRKSKYPIKQFKDGEIPFVPQSKLPRGHFYVRGIGITEKAR